VIRSTDHQLESNSSPRLTATAWCVAALLSAALVGLIHDRNYATASGADLVEDGRGIDDKSVMEGGLDAAQSSRAVGLVLLLTAGGICLLTAPTDARLRWDGLAMLIVLGLAWAAASILWSSERGTTARELVRLYLYVGVAAAIARRFDPRSLCCVLAIALGGSVLVAFAYEIITGGFRPWQADYRLTGSMHSNILAAQAAVVALIAYAFAVRRDPRAAMWWTIFVIATVIVYLTKARTALVSVAVGAAAVHVVGRPVRNWMLLATTAATLLAVALLAATMFGTFDSREAQRVASMGRTDDTAALTGRVPLWNFVGQQMTGHELEGYGWGAFWLVERTLAAHDLLGWYPRHSHNAYLQTVVNLGIVGLVIALAIGIWALARAIRQIVLTGRPEFSALAAVLVGMFVNGIAESAFVMPRDMGLFSAAVVFSVVFTHQHATSGVLEPSMIRRDRKSGNAIWGRRSLGPGSPNPN
jgi:O-antigen ligase